MKKLIAIALVMVLSLSLLAGCRSNKPAETTVPTTQSTTAPTMRPTTEPTTRPTTAPTTMPTTAATTAPTDMTIPDMDTLPGDMGDGESVAPSDTVTGDEQGRIRGRRMPGR